MSRVQGWRIAAAFAALALAGGCAAPQAETGALARPAAEAAPVTAAPDRAAQVADALLLATRAEQAQDSAALVRATLRLSQLGATPQTGEDSAAMARWQASLPADTAPLRGRALGPAYRSEVLEPGGTAQLHQTFLGGRSAQIVVRVARGPAPQLVVRDQSDRQVCVINGDPARCRWIPLYTQRHRIEIVNIGPEPSRFYIVFD